MTPFAIYLYGSNGGPLPTSFETVCERLAKLPRLYIELDGSWVWTGEDATGRPWQLDGMLYDAADSIQYVDLKGRCPHEIWQVLIESLAMPPGTQRPHSTSRSGSPPAPAKDWSVLRLPAQSKQNLFEFEQEIWGQAEYPE
jgi:hypothetical protein